MISFLGQCVQNLIQAAKYTLKGNVRLKSVISQISAIGFDSLGIVDFFVAVEEECGVDLEDSIVQIREASVIENLVDIIYGRILG